MPSGNIELIIRRANHLLGFPILAVAALRRGLSGPGQGSLYSGARSLRPPVIYRVFEDTLRPVPATAGKPPPWQSLVAEARNDLRRYHVGAVIINPVVALCPRFAPHVRHAAIPGLGLAIGYITAATGYPPQSVGGVLAWLHPRAARR